MPEKDNDHSSRPFSRRIRMMDGDMMSVFDALDRISALTCAEHELTALVGTTFSGTAYVAACCEALLDRVEIESKNVQ